MNFLMNVRKSLVKKIVASLFLLGFSVFISCALFSFHPNDPSWFFSSSNNLTVTNILGFMGANCAALLFFLFGSSALLLIPYLFFFTYVVISDELKIEWDRLVALLLAIFLCTAIGSFYHCAIMPHGFLPGGFFGSFLQNTFLRIADYTIALIFVHLMFLVCVIIASRLSILTLVHYGAKGMRFLIDKDRCIKPVFRYFSHLVYIVVVPFKKAFVWGYQLLSSYHIEKKQPGAAFDFDAVVQQEMQEVVKDPFWQEFSTQKPTADVFEKKQKYGQAEDNDSTQEDYGEKSEEGVNIIRKKDISYQLPPLDLFKNDAHRLMDPQLRQEHELMAKTLEEKLARFGIQGQVVSIKTGPVITLFEYQPHIDSKISKIVALEDDLALALQATSIRIIAPIPGTAVVGFEVANKVRSEVLFSSIIHSKEFGTYSGKLPLVLGVDTIGNTMIVDLTAMPHVLIAGSTGSGKSVAMNVILVSLLYRCKPDELKLILIDPKRLEFAPYADIPHLLFPIVTNPKDAAPVLQWVVNTMEQRYEMMAECGVRNVFDYNKLAANAELESLPFIVVMIDELSDLMMVAGKEIEEKIARIAQMARAAGIHLVVATQRPSVDVITGIIKANFPSRISFKIATKIDSRTILDTIGADKLLGKGDMLYLDMGSRLVRAHGAFVSDKEIEQVCNHIRSMQHVEYLDLLEELPTTMSDLQEGDEQLYQEVLAYLETIDEVSISALQRKFRIGYNRSARIMEMLEAQGMILAHNGSKMRKVLH